MNGDNRPTPSEFVNRLTPSRGGESNQTDLVSSTLPPRWSRLATSNPSRQFQRCTILKWIVAREFNGCVGCPSIPADNAIVLCSLGKVYSENPLALTMKIRKWIADG